MSQLKRLHPQAIGHAIDKARQYRLLNQPAQAESICLDILDIQPDHEDALITLLLCRTDQLRDGDPSYLNKAREVIPRMNDEYHKEYYSALICERQAMLLLRQRGTRSSLVSYQWFKDAMAQYEQAIQHKPPDEDEAILRWNFCMRMVERHRLQELDPEELEDLGIE